MLLSDLEKFKLDALSADRLRGELERDPRNLMSRIGERKRRVRVTKRIRKRERNSMK